MDALTSCPSAGHPPRSGRPSSADDRFGRSAVSASPTRREPPPLACSTSQATALRRRRVGGLPVAHGTDCSRTRRPLPPGRPTWIKPARSAVADPDRRHHSDRGRGLERARMRTPALAGPRRPPTRPVRRRPAACAPPSRALQQPAGGTAGSGASAARSRRRPVDRRRGSARHSGQARRCAWMSRRRTCARPRSESTVHHLLAAHLTPRLHLAQAEPRLVDGLPGDGRRGVERRRRSARSRGRTAPASPAPPRWRSGSVAEVGDQRARRRSRVARRLGQTPARPPPSSRRRAPRPRGACAACRSTRCGRSGRATASAGSAAFSPGSARIALTIVFCSASWASSGLPRIARQKR